MIQLTQIILWTTCFKKHIFPTELRHPNSGQGINNYKQSRVIVYEERGHVGTEQLSPKLHWLPSQFATN